MAKRDDDFTQKQQAAVRDDRLAGDTDDIILDGADDVRGIASDEDDDDFDEDDEDDLEDADEEEEEGL